MYSTSLICSLEQSYEILQISKGSMEIFGNMATVTKQCGRGVGIKMTTTLEVYIVICDKVHYKTLRIHESVLEGQVCP